MVCLVLQLAVGVNKTSGKFPDGLYDKDKAATQKSVVSCLQNRVDEDRFNAAKEVATAMVKATPL